MITINYPKADIIKNRKRRVKNTRSNELESIFNNEKNFYIVLKVLKVR